MTTSSTSPYRTLSPEETEDIASRILYEDNHVLVLNKRPGEIVQGDKTGDEPLVEKLKAFIALRDGKPGQVFMGVPHRLDRPVSGAVILAKTSKALTRLSAAFREGNAGKVYWALVENAPVPPEGEIRIYQKADSGQITTVMTSAGISVFAIYGHQQDLEGYFLDLMGKESKTGSSKKGGRRHA